jgi:hypothetical protein
MPKNLVDLGAAIVLQPSELRIGQITKLEGHPFIISELTDNNVVFIPLTGWKLYKHYWTILSGFGKVLCILMVLFTIVALTGFGMFLFKMMSMTTTLSEVEALIKKLYEF